LPFAVEGSQRLAQAEDTEPMRVTVNFRFPLAPSGVAFDALVLHLVSSPEGIGGQASFRASHRLEGCSADMYAS
jgi:hypothetical protein